MTSLDEFAESRRPKNRRAWWFSLPEEIRAEIVASPASSETVVEWLHSIGYDEATFGRLDPWRRGARRDRPTEP